MTDTSKSERPIAFISYAREDLGFVEKELVPLCERHGYMPWWDTRGIDPGEEFASKITEKVSHSKLFLLIMSPSAQASRWVKDELHLAFHLGKKVIPLMYREADPLQFHIHLLRLQVLDVHASPEALDRLLGGDTRGGELASERDVRDLTTKLIDVAITLLPWQEQSHLRNLAQGTTANYRGGRPVRHELRRLCSLGLCRRKPGRTIGVLKRGTVLDLSELVELTEVGEELAKYIR